jgi:hypothetical protein
MDGQGHRADAVGTVFGVTSQGRQIFIETVAVPGSHQISVLRQSPLRGRLPADGNRKFFGTVWVDERHAS